jgi:rubredoxin
MRNNDMAQYQCPDCGYIYDETVGCEREGYAAGTKWEDVPEDFPCPDCFVREKPDFEELT